MLAPGDHRRVLELEVAQPLQILLVADQLTSALPSRDVGDLRTGEVRVQQHGTGADPRGGEHRDEQTDVVAREQSDAVAGGDTARTKRVGERVCLPFELDVGDARALVDDRGPVTVAERRNRGAAPRAPYEIIARPISTARRGGSIPTMPARAHMRTK